MFYVYAIASGPVAIGLATAAVLWVMTAKNHAELPSVTRAFTAGASATGLLLMSVYQLWLAWPFWMPDEWSFEDQQSIAQARFIAPLAIGFVMLVLALPHARSERSHVADLTPRTVRTFTTTGWLITASALTVVSVAIAVTAGAASEPNEAGEFARFSLEIGTMTVSTSIYGWFFSVPCLILLFVIAVVVIVNLLAISRPPLREDSEADSRTRHLRTRNVLITASGAILLHLGSVLGSLAGTASMTGGLQTGNAGWIDVSGPFAALEPALRIAAFIADACGFAAWWMVLFSTFPTLARRLRKAVHQTTA